jgi:hypothetical protein
MVSRWRDRRNRMVLWVVRAIPPCRSITRCELKAVRFVAGHTELYVVADLVAPRKRIPRLLPFAGLEDPNPTNLKYPPASLVNSKGKALAPEQLPCGSERGTRGVQRVVSGTEASEREARSGRVSVRTLRAAEPAEMPRSISVDHYTA